MLVGELGVEVSYQFREPSVGKLPAPRFEGSPYPLPIVVTIDVERAIALIRTHFSAAWSEKSAGLEVSPECVQVRCLLSRCSHYLKTQPNQWIRSLVVRLAYTRAAALAEIVIVV